MSQFLVNLKLMILLLLRLKQLTRQLAENRMEEIRNQRLINLKPRQRLMQDRKQQIMASQQQTPHSQLLKLTPVQLLMHPQQLLLQLM